MSSQRIVGLCFWIIITPVAAGAQQRGAPADAPPATTTTVAERTYSTVGVLPLRRVERRTESGGRKVLIETVEWPGIEGQWEPVEEVATTKTPTHAQRDVFRFDFDHRRRLAVTTESEETQANGIARNVERTQTADLDGHLTVSSGYVEETTLRSPGVQQTDAILSPLSIEGSLRGAERWQSAEQQINSAVVRHDSTHLVRDLNGRWLPVEARSGETRGVGSAERADEEAFRRHNLTEVIGALVVSDKVVTRASESSTEDRVVIDTYSQDAEGFRRNDSHLALQQRVRSLTTVAADGARSTVEEIEARDFVAPNDPMRVIRRTITTVRNVGAGRSVTERQIFERDVNGRMVLVANDAEETTTK